jgi:hypothetical protein
MKRKEQETYRNMLVCYCVTNPSSIPHHLKPLLESSSSFSMNILATDPSWAPYYAWCHDSTNAHLHNCVAGVNDMSTLCNHQPAHGAMKPDA